jgi:hypothetical protein
LYRSASANCATAEFVGSGREAGQTKEEDWEKTNLCNKPKVLGFYIDFECVNVQKVMFLHYSVY